MEVMPSFPKKNERMTMIKYEYLLLMVVDSISPL